MSLSKGNDKYLYTSHFDSLKTVAAKAIITKNLGRPKEDNDRIEIWDEKGISVRVRQGKVQIEMYDDKADKALISKVEKMADEIQKTLK